MRRLLHLAGLLVLLGGPAIAAPGGYTFDVPTDFVRSADAAAGDVFRSHDGRRFLRVHAAASPQGSFEQAMAAILARAGADGWALSDTIVTPSWASYSGLRNGMVLNARVIALCGGVSYASVALEYPERDLPRMQTVAGRLQSSLQATGSNC